MKNKVWCTVKPFACNLAEHGKEVTRLFFCLYGHDVAILLPHIKSTLYGEIYPVKLLKKLE